MATAVDEVNSAAVDQVNAELISPPPSSAPPTPIRGVSSIQMSQLVVGDQPSHRIGRIRRTAAGTFAERDWLRDGAGRASAGQPLRTILSRRPGCATSLFTAPCTLLRRRQVTPNSIRRASPGFVRLTDPCRRVQPSGAQEGSPWRRRAGPRPKFE